MVNKLVFAVMLLVAAFTAPLNAAIINGGFETGDFTGWTKWMQVESAGDFFVESGTSSPLSNTATAGPAGGDYYAVSDNLGPSVVAISQPFVAGTSTVFEFDEFAYSATTPGYFGIWDFAGSVQWAELAILPGNAVTAFDPALVTLTSGADVTTPPIAWTHHVVDVSQSLTPGEDYLLVYRVGATSGLLVAGLDNVQVIPEPSSVVLLGVGVAALLIPPLRRRLRR